MAKIIAKRNYVKAADGTIVAYETKYYHFYDGKHASAGAKIDAVRMDADFAEMVCAQLNTIAGTGWWVMDEEDSPAREKRVKPTKAIEARA